MHGTRCSGLVHWDDPEGWDGEGGGRGVQEGGSCTPMADSCQCMAKRKMMSVLTAKAIVLDLCHRTLAGIKIVTKVIGKMNV